MQLEQQNSPYSYENETYETAVIEVVPDLTAKKGIVPQEANSELFRILTFK